jgi:glutamate synthase domain-containing protein 2/glutamate synthase domain-containing protein 3
MAEEGKEPIGSMGDDMPVAILSKNSRLLYGYFKQLFAQVTNPPIDPIREEVVMSLTSFIGPEKNIMEETAEHAKRIKVNEPILTNEDLAKIKNINFNNFRTKTISLLCKASDKNDFKATLDRISQEAFSAINEGYSFVLLSDKGVNENFMAVPALLAVGTVHQYLLKKAVRKRISIILESAEPREVFHFALLFGYGADLVNPYLAYQILENMVDEKSLTITKEKAIYNYRHSIDAGILKILSKMGISTLQSYRGAQIFEAMGIGEEVINKSFTGTPSRIGGIDFDIIAEETIIRHTNAFSPENKSKEFLATGGFYQWKKDGEFHLWNPDSIPALQEATRTGNYKKFKEFSELINNQSNQPTTLRGLLKFKNQKSISIDEVESEDEIIKRFCTGAMSFGSISRGAHETLAIAMNRLKGKSNTGEGGEDPERFIPMPNGDSKRSAIKQVASGRFGVNSNYLANADEIQIKIAQGAKPGEGGQLPGHKVSAIIAKTRYTTPGVTLISPPPHHDIYSIEDLAQLIFDLKNANPNARISVKLVSEIGVGTIAAGVAKGHADMILISGGDGGTGASPLSSIKYAGLPWELGLSETHQTLVLNDLRSRVRLQADGQMRTGKDVIVATLLGAEEYGFCTAVLIVMGCVMLRHCHLNNCSLGVATQDDMLEPRFNGQVEAVINFMRFVAREVREIMAELGVKKINDIIGRTDLLEVNSNILPWKAKNIDYSKILYKPNVPENIGRYCTKTQDHGIDKVLDKALIEEAKPAIKDRKEVFIQKNITNVDRTVGAMLSYEISKNYGDSGLNENTIHCKFDGTAGQSFGAFLAKGITFELEGIANDYVGKGISGGKIIIYPSKNTDYLPENNVIIGNTTFYGAIHGEAYIRGTAGERFCIRNSGLNAVVEGVGDHGCEYMTGGKVVILGQTGINFGAGMSGGVAYVYDFDGKFKYRCNMEMIEIDNLDDEDLINIHSLLHNHKKYTGSTIVDKFLDGTNMNKIVKVMPLEYKRILQQKKLEKKLGTGTQE